MKNYTIQDVPVFLSTPVEIAPMNGGFIPPKIDGFGEDKKQINSVYVCA